MILPFMFRQKFRQKIIVPRVAAQHFIRRDQTASASGKKDLVADLRRWLAFAPTDDKGVLLTDGN